MIDPQCASIYAPPGAPFPSHTDVGREMQFQIMSPNYVSPSKSGDTDFVPPSLHPTAATVSKDVTIDPVTGVSARLFLPKTHQQDQDKNGPRKAKLPILVYYHGGGFYAGSPFCSAYHYYVTSLASQSNVLAVSVDYRLAPKNLLPAGYDDSWAALKWVASHADGGGPEPWLTNHGDCKRIFVAGDSAGANICHQMALRVWVNGLGFGIDRIEGMALVHPYFWGSNPIVSEEKDPKKREAVEEAWRMVSSRGIGIDDPWINPLAEGAPSLKGIPCERVLVCVAGMDFLVERGRAYRRALKKSGWEGEVGKLVESEGEGHCFHLRDPKCEKALELMGKLVAFFNGKEEVVEDGFFRRVFRWVILGGCLGRGKSVKVADHSFKELAPWP